MDTSEINLSPLRNAISRLSEGLSLLGKEPGNALLRDGVIQRFEFTYELSIKMIRRYLKSIAATDDEVNELTFRELIRRAGDLKLLQGDITDWLRFRQARTDTVHTYNEMRALEVAGASTKFASEAQTLLRALKERTGP